MTSDQEKDGLSVDFTLITEKETEKSRNEKGTK